MDLTASQALYISTTDRNCCAVAGPGSGKTAVVVAKIARILGENPKNKVMAITFSREAARTLKERVLKHSHGNGADRVTTGTFHSIAMGMAKRVCEERNRRMPRPLVGGERRSYVARAIEDAGLEMEIKEAESAIDRYRSVMCPEEDVAIANLVARYDDLLHANRVTDFSKIMKSVTQQIYSETIEPLDITHLIIDEAQDIDDVQFHFAKTHMELKLCITDMVGDDDQSIYAFRNGLGVAGMRKFKSLAPNTLEVVLETNFRCRSEILHWATSVIGENQNRIAKNLVSNRGQGGYVRYYGFDTRDNELSGVAGVAKDALGEVGSGKSAAILSRNNDLLQLVMVKLNNIDCPYRRIGTSSFWDSDPVKHFIEFLRSIALDRYSNGVGQFLYWCGISSYEISQLTESSNGCLISTLADETKNILWLRPDRPGDVEGLQELVSKWRKYAKSEDQQYSTKIVNELRDWMLQDRVLKNCRVLSDKGSGESYRRWVTLSITSAAKTLAGGSGSLMSRLKMAGNLDKTNSPNDEAVVLSSMHSSKGLEWDSVFIIGCEQEITPGKATGEDIEEERRVFYVGMTRARDYLVLTSAKHDSPDREADKEQGQRTRKRKSRERSSFITCIPDALEINSNRPWPWPSSNRQKQAVSG